jgi:hypothetical protein
VYVEVIGLSSMQYLYSARGAPSCGRDTAVSAFKGKRPALKGLV